MAVAEQFDTGAEFDWAEPAVRADGVDFFYGEGDARFQVLFDNRTGVARALEHLHGLGHRRIAVLRRPGSPTTEPAVGRNG